MAAKITLDSGFGYAEITVGEAQATLDLWEANNVYVQFATAGADPLAVMQSWCDWLASKGLPGLSHGAGIQLQEHIVEAIRDLKKNAPSLTSAG